MTSHRSYRRPQSPASAKAELARCGGDHFDPDIVRAFLRVSTGYLAWLLFPVAWLAQLALTFGGASGAVARALRSGAQSATAVGAGTVAVVAGVAMGLAPVSKPASHPGATHVATAPPPAAAEPAAPQPAAPVVNDLAPPAARSTRATAGTTTGAPTTSGAPTPSPPSPTSPPPPPPKAAPTPHVIRLAACVDPVRIVIEAIPGVSITPTRAC